jgi:hypothetical protein
LSYGYSFYGATGFQFVVFYALNTYGEGVMADQESRAIRELKSELKEGFLFPLFLS